MQDPWALRGVLGELDGALDRLGAGVREEAALQPVVAAGDESLGQQPRQQGAVELDQVRQVEVDGLDERLLYDRMGPAEGEDAEAREEVEVALTGPVVEVAALAPFVEAVEAERLQYSCQLRVEIFRVEAEVLAAARVDQSSKVEAQWILSAQVPDKAYRPAPLPPDQ